MKALIDGDILVYRAGYAAQSVSYEFLRGNDSTMLLDARSENAAFSELKSKGLTNDEGMLLRITTPDSIENTLHSVKIMISDILSKSRATEHTIYLTSNDKSNYRFNIAKTLPYKGNRTQPKPFHYQAIRDYLVNYHAAQIICGEEADDAMGIEQVRCSAEGKKSVICSIDKDMKMIPGEHYNFVTGEFVTATEFGALDLSKDRRKILGTGLKWFYAQMLLGDSADNIPGLDGYGPVTVWEILSGIRTEKELIDTTVEHYMKAGVDSRYLEVVDLLWIRRYPNEVASFRVGLHLPGGER